MPRFATIGDAPNPCRTNFIWEFPAGDEISQPRVAKLPWVICGPLRQSAAKKTLAIKFTLNIDEFR